MSMNPPNKAEREGLTEQELWYKLMTDAHHAESWRREAQRRHALGKLKALYGLNGPTKPPVQNKPPWSFAAREFNYWPSDTKVREEYALARMTFLEHLDEFWNDEKQQKSKEEIKDFLLTLEDYDEYDDMSEPQQRLFGVVRRAHKDWVRG